MENKQHAAQDSRPVIFVTGFGPYPCHPINASQAAVELLAKENIEEELDVRLVTEIVNVEYDYVKKTIPQRWKELRPKLSVHVGVSGIAEHLTLEQRAHNTGYAREDNCGCVPSNGMCHADGKEVIESSIQMDLISSTLKKAAHLKLPCVKSLDPGRFLCEFTYYLSLTEDKSRSAFIHVPTLNRFTAEETAAALAAAIKAMYLQVQGKEASQEATEENGNVVTREECQDEQPLENITAAVAL